jgi:hypothetical protein
MTALAPLLEALSRIEDYETDFERGADDNVASVQNIATAALDAFARRAPLRDEPKLIVEVGACINAARGGAPWSTANLHGQDMATARAILDAIEAHLLGPREAGPAKAPECKSWCGTVAKPGESEERVGAFSGEPHPFIDYCTRECCLKAGGAIGRRFVGVLHGPHGGGAAGPAKEGE